MSPNLVICEPNSKKVCGNEAVCMLLNATTHYCMCIHTSEPMTLKGKCSIKKVEVKPSKIYDLTMPQNGHKLITINNATNSSFKAATKDSVTTLANSFGVPVSFSPIAIFLSSSLVLIVALFLLWKTMCHRFGFKRKKNDKNKAFAIQLEKNILVEERYTTNPQYTSAGATTDVSVGLVPILSRNSITDLQKIGEGFFGKVYRGQLHTVDNGEEHVETVAVKMLKQTANLEAEEDFMREVEIMSSFHHPNILILIGVCPREHLNPPWMIFEFMPFGDLADVLRNSSHLFWKSVPALPTLSPEALLSISSQIANGMEYLAAQRFVHRDLACRNCLVGSTLTVKISDFGMSRDVYTCDYYKIGGTRMLPVRWMSPESILYGKFTLESDVWSYGVVLWEIYNYGKQPYFGHTNEEVLKFILEGIVLDTPENCPNEIAEIMKLCWRKDPKERIQFLDICNRLSKLKENLSRHDVPCLPRPPPVPVTIDYPILFEDEPEDNLDEDNYLRPKSPPSNSLLNGYVETLP